MFEEERQNQVGLEDDQAFQSSLIPADDVRELPEAEIIESGEEVGGSSVIQAPSWVGKRFGRFKLLRLLGEGSMGRVILAEDLHLHRNVALKVLRRRIKGLDGEAAVQQFLREARGAAALDHPNVVRIHEINEHDGWWYIAMEYIDGDTMQRIVKAAGPLSPHRACTLIADAATALETAHEHGITHRDVKPSNIMVNRRGHGKLMDFGLVRLDAMGDPFEMQEKSVGTPKFMAPEVIRRDKAGPAIDVYSLGATFYFALTGHPPYVGEKVKDILKQHLKADVPDVRVERPNCPDNLADLIMRMMAKNPLERPTVGDVAATLRAEAIDSRLEDSDLMSGVGGSSVLSRSAIAAEPTIITSHHPRLKNLAMTAVALLAIVGACVGLYLLNQPDPATGAASLAELFPDAPVTYGERPAGELPVPEDPRPNLPPSSGLNKFDTNEILFIGSKNGRYYYPIDSREAALITGDNIRGYTTEQEAIDEGKELFPGR